MARVPGQSKPASLGHKLMPRTIYCPQCGVVLNVPDSAAGRKLRCPKCATKFAAPAAAAANPGDSVIAGPSPDSSMVPNRSHKTGPASSGDFGLAPRRDSSGSIELPTYDLPMLSPSSGDFELPSSPGPLRETFDLPLMGEVSPKSSASKTRAAAPVPASVPVPSTADVLGLFQDEPKSNRKLSGAEARAKPRRCPSCGGVVGVGMSLCNTCGLDLDTGQRITPIDVFDDEMPAAPKDPTPSLGVMFVGGLSAMVNLMLAVISIVAWAKGAGAGMLLILVVWGFGIYASVQFLRRKAIRPLFLALGLGVGIGVVYLIALPIWEANVVSDVVITNPGDPAPSTDPNDPDLRPLRNLGDQLDMNRITWGIAVLLTYAALSVYMNSPSLRREFTRR